MKIENIQDNNKDNAELIYQHTLSIVKEKRDSITRLDTKTSALLAFSGLSLRFLEIPSSGKIFELSFNEPIFWYLLLKFLSYVSALLCAIFCILGLRGISVGGTANPLDMLEDEIFNRDETTNKCALIKTWSEVTKEYTEVLKNKQSKLNNAFLYISFSLVTSTLGSWISTLLIPKNTH